MADGSLPTVQQTPEEICNACGAYTDVEPKERPDGQTERTCTSCPVQLARSDPDRRNVPFQQPSA